MADGRLITHIHFHHSAGASGNAATIRAMHEAKGWGEIGYHAVVCNGDGGPDGEVQFGKDDSHTAYSVGNYLNYTALAICMIGDFTQGSPTEKQWDATVGWVREKVALYNIPRENVLGHREARANSACPGFADIVCEQFRADVFGQGGGEEMAFDTIAMSRSDGGTKFHGHYDNTGGVKNCWIIVEVDQADEAGKAWPFSSVKVVAYKTQGAPDTAIGQYTIAVGDNHGIRIPGLYSGAVEVDVVDHPEAVNCYIRTVT
jgi:hypothetical protein